MAQKNTPTAPPPAPDLPAGLEKRFQAILEACDRIHREFEHMTAAKRQYEEAVERFLDEVAKNPAAYKRRLDRGKGFEEHPLTEDDLRTLRASFRRGTIDQPTALFFCDWDDCECRERSGCVRLSCDPVILVGCCYLCLSPAIIQCSF